MDITGEKNQDLTNAQKQEIRLYLRRLFRKLTATLLGINITILGSVGAWIYTNFPSLVASRMAEKLGKEDTTVGLVISKSRNDLKKIYDSDLPVIEAEYARLKAYSEIYGPKLTAISSAMDILSERFSRVSKGIETLESEISKAALPTTTNHPSPEKPTIQLPGNLVAFFAENSCPQGWQSYEGAKGRYIVGLNDNGMLGATAGLPLKDRESRPVGQHEVLYTYMAIGGDGGDIAWGGGGRRNTTTGKAVVGEIPGTNAPYIQLLACVYRG